MGVDSTCMTGDGSRVRALALLVVMTLLVGVVPASGASTDAKLHRAQGELGDLVSQIAEQAAAIDDLRGRVAAADHRIDVAERALGLVLASRIAVRDELEAAQAAYADAGSRLHDTVVDAFMNSPGGLAEADVLGAFLQASSMGDLQDRLALGDAIVAERERAVSGLATAKAALDARARELDGALAAQQATVAELRSARVEQANALASEQAAMGQVTEARDRIVSLIARVKQRLHAEDVAAVARAFQGADHVSYGQWADMLLHIFDAPTCRENRVVVVAWQVQEFTQAAWNPLATTHRMPGSTDFNGVGVQNFVSLEQGLEATKETIQNGWDIYGYGAIVGSLRGCGDALTTASRIAASSWCPGCLDGNYVVGVVPKVEADFETYASL
jgi:uncharacterized coiled-coil protein SlyX